MPRRSYGELFRHRLAQNTLALYGVQFGTFVVPLVTLPYVARVLGDSAFGLVVLSQGFGLLLVTVLDFGFVATASRAVSTNRNDPQTLARNVASTQGAKLMLVGAALAASLVALMAIPQLRDNPEYAAYATIAALGSGLTPWWFFLGTEKIRLAALIQLSGRALAAALTFVLVKDPDDGWLILALWAGAEVIVSSTLNLMMYRQVRLLAPRLKGALASLRESAVLFVGVGALSLYTSANVVLLGLFAPNAQVAHFGASERVARAGSLVIGPVVVAVYPRLSFLQSEGKPERAERLAWVALAVLGTIGLLGGALVFLLAPVIISVIFGPDFEESVPLLRLLALILPLTAVANVAAGWMISMRMDATLSKNILFGGVLNVALACALAPVFGPIGVACSVVAAEAAVLAGCTIAIRRQRAVERSELEREVGAG